MSHAVNSQTNTHEEEVYRGIWSGCTLFVQVCLSEYLRYDIMPQTDCGAWSGCPLFSPGAVFWILTVCDIMFVWILMVCDIMPQIDSGVYQGVHYILRRVCKNAYGILHYAKDRWWRLIWVTLFVRARIVWMFTVCDNMPQTEGGVWSGWTLFALCMCSYVGRKFDK